MNTMALHLTYGAALVSVSLLAAYTFLTGRDCKCQSLRRSRSGRGRYSLIEEKEEEGEEEGGGSSCGVGGWRRAGQCCDCCDWDKLEGSCPCKTGRSLTWKGEAQEVDTSWLPVPSSLKAPPRTLPTRRSSSNILRQRKSPSTKLSKKKHSVSLHNIPLPTHPSPSYTRPQDSATGTEVHTKTAKSTKDRNSGGEAEHEAPYSDAKQNAGSGARRSSSPQNGLFNTNTHRIAATGDAEENGDPVGEPRVAKLILIRHGQSMWNRQATKPDALWRYAGACDVPLSRVGVQEAISAGEHLKDLPVDIIFTSEMDRAITTAMIMMTTHHSGKCPMIQKGCNPLKRPPFRHVNCSKQHEFVSQATKINCGMNGIIPIFADEALNERSFGKLQGMPSTLHREYYTEDELRSMRNLYREPFPAGESCADVTKRVLPYFEQYIVPHLKVGRNVLVSSHGFVIRCLIKHLESMSEDEFNEQMKLEKTRPSDCRLLVPTGVPFVYDYDIDAHVFYKESQTKKERRRSLSRSSAPY